MRKSRLTEAQMVRSVREDIVGHVLRRPIAVLVLLSGCSRSTPADRTDSGPPPPASTPSVTRTAGSSSSSGVGFGFGHSSIGAGHVSMKVESRDGPSRGDFGSLYEKLSACYKASPHRNASEAVRVSLQLTVSPTGVVTTTATTALGHLVDQGHGRQGYAFAEELAKNDDVLSKCIDVASKTATVAVPETSRGTGFGITVELSP